MTVHCNPWDLELTKHQDLAFQQQLLPHLLAPWDSLSLTSGFSHAKDEEPLGPEPEDDSQN